jgi:type I restriction enzyme R subunit
VAARHPAAYTEEETRFYRIDPVLRAKGYDAQWKLRLETPAPVETSTDDLKGRRRSGKGRTDYLLCIQPEGQARPLPVGVLEAKAESADPLKGMQQAKGYYGSAGGPVQRHAVRWVFATNGHRYAEFDRATQTPVETLPLESFPTHAELTTRWQRDSGVDLSRPQASLLFQADSPAYNRPRYYQDAAIRAVFEKVLRCEQDGSAPRALLSLATGAGKTVIAANLLWRLHEAGRLDKPALFLCDRDELRRQAMDKIGRAFPAGAVRAVQEERGLNTARNARVQVATYQTLGIDSEPQREGDQPGETDDDSPTPAPADSFLSRHYGENAFSVIIIDECHRSAWGRWSEVLRRNPQAIQIGLTATPRQLRSPRRTGALAADIEAAAARDARITANNLAYFGAPVYEYTLIQAQEDGYLAACEIVRLRPSIDARTFTRDEVAAHHVHDARTGAALPADELKAQYGARQFDDDLILPERIEAMCADLFARLCACGGPEQKVIVFCTRDLHADRVALQLQKLYARWCEQQGRVTKEHYAFKCTAEGGAELLEPMRGSGERCFIACTVDLLATGVDIERLNAVVFFRSLASGILFYQMVGRGTRLDERTRKFKFWLYDYTGVTDLFGTEFISAARKLPPDGGNGGGSGGGGGGNDDEDGSGTGPTPPPLPELRTGEAVTVEQTGRCVLQAREVDGVLRDVAVPLEEYRRGLIERVLAEAATLDDFRGLWVQTQRRRALVEHLLAAHYSPEELRRVAEMADYDSFDLFAEAGYAARALRRRERADTFLAQQAHWLAAQPDKTATVLRAFARQFSAGGTEALESREFWHVPEVARAGGLKALAPLGVGVEVVRDVKMRLFGA